MTRPKIIVPIITSSFQQALQDCKTALSKGADLIELRLDLIAPKSPLQTKQLILASKKKCIATNRTKREGGAFKASEKKRVQLLKQAISLGAPYADIELSTAPSLRNILVKFACAKGAKTIISFHDFTKTPPIETLAKILQREANSRADICKITTYSKTQKDNWTIMQIANAASAKKIPHMIFAMGNKGKPTRIQSAKTNAWGIFAALSNTKKSAPGQLTLNEVDKLLVKKN